MPHELALLRTALAVCCLEHPLDTAVTCVFVLLARLNSITFFLFYYSQDNFPFCLTFPLYIYFVYLHLGGISVSQSAVIRCLIKQIP